MVNLTFDDEFNSLNLWNGTSGVWQPSFSWSPNGYAAQGSLTWWTNPGYGPTSASDADPYQVQNGVLNLQAMQTPADVNAADVGNQPYISGLLNSQSSFSQEYGYFEMRAEMPTGNGLMGAFWLLPENGSRPPELDVTEVVSKNPTTVVNTIITNDGGPETVLNHWSDPGNTETGYHTYAVDWEPNTITWYFDGVQTFQEATPSDAHQPMYMLLDTLVGNAASWEGAPDASMQFPNSGMKVDYVRVYDSNPNTAGVTPTPTPAPTPTPTPVPTPAPTPAPVQVTTGSGSDNLAFGVSEDAYQGDAQFTVLLDGKQLGGIYTTTASHVAGTRQTFSFLGDWAIGTHSVTVNFLNDAYGGQSTLDRNLYVDNISYNGADTHQSAQLYGNGPVGFSVADTTAVPTVTGSGSDTLVLGMAEDAYQGDAQFTVSVDGKQHGSTFTTTASKAAGANQSFVIKGDFGSGQHTVAVNFLNDAYGGSGKLDRNLYVNSVAYNGTDTKQSAALYGDGPQSFTVSGGTTAAVNETGDHGSLHKTLSQTGTYTLGSDTFVVRAGNAATVALGTGASQIKFLGASSLALTGGSGQATVTADAGSNKFVVGTGSLEVTGGGGKDDYVFHASGGLLKVDDFSLAKGDTLTVDKALQGSLTQASDGNGGVMLGFGTGAGHGVDVHGLASMSSSNILWT